jgi:hypothetical protein
MYRVGRPVKLLSLSLLGGLLVLMRHILQTLQPLASALAGDEHIYKWTYRHVYYKESGAPDVLPLVVLHAPDIGVSACEMRSIVAEPAYLRATGFGLSDHPDIDYSADLSVAL